MRLEAQLEISLSKFCFSIASVGPKCSLKQHKGWNRAALSKLPMWGILCAGEIVVT